MDAVKSFNAELSSLYEVKPPISKAKMTALTRGAIKAIKFYKHVVQSVEKFILKCKAEYKVPGLYVIDSIVRQSRHQFGADKDVFAPRFAKNMQQTFVNLFKCPPEDKSKVIRVLNLWQKNQVFAPDVIQPLFDLADPNHPIHKELSAAMQNNGMATQGAILKGSPALQKTPTKTPASADPAALAQLGSISNNTSTLDPNTLAQLQQLHRLLLRQTDGGPKPEGPPVHFDRKLLDFDYGSDEEDDPTNPSPKQPPANNAVVENVGSLLSNPEVLRQLQTLQQSMINNQNLHPEFDLEKLRKLQEMKQQEDEFDKHLAQTVPNLPFAAECEFKPNNSPAILSSFFLPAGADLSQPPPGYKPSLPYDIPQPEEIVLDQEVEFLGTADDIEVIDIDHGDSRSPSRDRYRRRRSRSKERSRDRNRDRDRRSRRSRSRSRSRSRRHRTRSRERDRERDKDKEKDKEKEKERKKRGLPPIKKDNLSVCSTTLWVGHLSKLVHQEDLSDTFGEFGEIISIDLIIPRGCAFIVMNRRQDAARCLTKLKSHKMQGKAITLAWAPGKGVKGKELKDYWEGDLGVSYIPYMKLKPGIDIELLEDGGMVDEDTLPPWMKEQIAQVPKKENEMNTTASFIQISEGPPPPVVDMSQPPPVPTTGLLQPPPMTMPLVSPFQLNNRMLGMPPGMMPNVPMGVPPPNMQSAMLSNQLLGIGSPFGQGLLHPPMAQMSSLDKNPNEGIPPSLSEQLINFGMLPPQPPPVAMAPSNEDNMDVEMEDAEHKIEHKTNLSDQLLASISNFNGGNDNGNRSHRSSDNDKRDDRNRSKERDRDRTRSRKTSRDRRDRGNDREGSRGERRDRPNRWGERRESQSQNQNRDENRDDRREREKALNDRLREMAGDNSFREEKERPPPLLERPVFPFNNGEPPIEKPPERFSRRRGEEFPIDFEGPPLDFKPPPPEFDAPPRNFEAAREFDVSPRKLIAPPRDFDVPPRDFDGPPRDFEGPSRDFEGPPHEFDGPPRDFDAPPRDFEGPPCDDFEGPPLDFDGPPDDFVEPPPEFDGPPEDFDGPPREFDLPPREFIMPPRDFDGMPRPLMLGREPRGRGMDRFDDRRRGPPDFFLPREGFGPRGPRFRGPGPDGFAPRGPPLMRPPHMFHPRGPHMRGPRPGPPGPPWMEGMRPNFPPRFDGPPDFYRGPPGGPPFDGPPFEGPPFEGPPFDGPPFEEPPHHRIRRHEERRHFRPDFEGDQEPPQEFDNRPERRSRWGNSSPHNDGPSNQLNEQPGDAKEKTGNDSSEVIEIQAEECVGGDKPSEDKQEPRGNTTPLHDEPQEPPAQQPPPVEVETDASSKPEEQS